MKKLSRNLVSMLVLLILLITVLAAIYAFGIHHFKSHFFTGSTINGVNVGDMDADDAKYAIQNQIRNYTLTCTERNGLVDTITGDQIYMQYVDDGSIERLLNKQNSNFWIFYLGRGKTYQIDIGYTYDKDSIDTVLSNMECFKAENDIDPTNAGIVDDGTEFVVSEATEGASPDYDKVRQAVIEAIESGTTTLDFDEADLYRKPTTSADDESVQSLAADVNQFLTVDITYDFVDRTFTIDKNNIRGYLIQDGDTYTLSKSKIAAFVEHMAYETDTYGLKHSFRTTSGATIELASGGDYGWCINQEETTLDLYNAILNGENGTRTPVYLYRGLDRSSNDIGDTYVEICIEKQEMWCYQDGVLVVDTPVVTGDDATGKNTPSGCVWAIDLKQSPATFDGGTKVTYWLPFYDSCGIHDASWRTEDQYGGTTWLTNGSHGCINTPEEAVAKIYEVMDVGYPVIVYYSEEQPVGKQPTSEVTPG